MPNPLSEIFLDLTLYLTMSGYNRFLLRLHFQFYDFDKFSEEKYLRATIPRNNFMGVNISPESISFSKCSGLKIIQEGKKKRSKTNSLMKLMLPIAVTSCQNNQRTES